MVPIFKELMPYLLEAQEIATEGEDRVFRDVDPDSNLRTNTLKTLRRTGITDEIPRFFQNCRSSRQAELEAEFPLHVVCAWLGNSEKTARKHYLKIQENHFQIASGDSASKVVHGKVQESGEWSPPLGTTKHEKTLENVSSPVFHEDDQYTREDSNLQPPVPKTGALSS